MAEESILDLLHEDHEEAEELIENILEEEDGAARAQLFTKLRDELVAHLQAEAKVLYARMEKQDENEEGHHFALEGTIEHELVEQQLAILAKSRNKAAEDWTARMEVVQELVQHHIEEEEDEGHRAARALFDEPTLIELGEEFKAAKERLLSGGGRTRPAAARRAPAPAFAGSKPRGRARSGARGKRSGR
jgi:hypothetical protein